MNTIQSADNSGELDLRQILQALWRGKFWIILVAITALLIGGFYAYRIAVPQYTATTSLALQVRDQQVVNLGEVMSGVSTDASSMNTELEIIQSRRLMHKLVNALDLKADPEFNATLRDEVSVFSSLAVALGAPFTSSVSATTKLGDAAALNATIAALKRSIQTSTVRNSYIFTISVTTADPEKSALVANTLARLYVEDQIETKFEAIENATEWLSSKVTDLEIELEERAEVIERVRVDTAITSREEITVLNRQLLDVRQRLAEAETRTAEAEQMVLQFQAARALGDAGMMTRVAADPQLAALATDLLDERSDSQAAFDQRFDVLSQQAQLRAERAEEQRAALEQSVLRLSRQVAEKTDGLAELQQLQREFQAVNVLYDTFLTRLRQTTIQLGVEQPDSQVLSESTRGQLVAPRKSRILGLSLILGTMLGSALVLTREFLQDTLRTAEDVETSTGYAVMGQIPVMPIGERAGLVDYLVKKPTSAAAEAIRNLRTSILLSNVDNPPQVIMSTSSLPNEGKTTQAIALAQNLAGLGSKVLLVEGDIRRRTFSAYFGIADDARGLLSVLTSKTSLQEAIIHNDKMGVDILPGEKSPLNAADVFSSTSFRNLLTKMREIYDYIIIDTPPVLVVPDARVIGQHVDAIIFSVAWDLTTRSQVQDGLKQLETVNAKVTGLVLARIDPAGMRRYGYGGKYGAYSRYGAAYYDD